ncbi:MAG: hypothetical protein H6830_00345 [Planctomycetes bacterium]|nr:hypothetical protein [Planctomycetota bacterium]MCB9910783.1 hypothetical protein [Planctomycetota bacterium]MCB9912810.1 hypothetical protein [Planctomycetota bacterium]HPF14887.1 hypothetical protein [Planctomycetota bacterium]HRV81647.1 hypothetical protein [Planctomycetota bacterium]
MPWRKLVNHRLLADPLRWILARPSSGDVQWEAFETLAASPSPRVVLEDLGRPSTLDMLVRATEAMADAKED